MILRFVRQLCNWLYTKPIFLQSVIGSIYVPIVIWIRHRSTLKDWCDANYFHNILGKQVLKMEMRHQLHSQSHRQRNSSEIVTAKYLRILFSDTWLLRIHDKSIKYLHFSPIIDIRTNFYSESIRNIYFNAKILLSVLR